jgi:cytochrome c-type biogenesis protein CcmE
MSRRIRWVAWIAALTTVGLATVLAITLFTDRVPPYRHADQVVRDAAQWQGKTVSVHGIVSEESRAGEHRWRFNLVWQGESLSVIYGGPVPDTFVDGAVVVVQGKLRDREFVARQMAVRVPM